MWNAAVIYITYFVSGIFPGWTRQVVAAEVKRTCETYGKLYFIPSASQGLPLSNYEGVYEALTEEIDHQSKLLFK